VLGMVFGAVFGGRIMMIGRRKALIISFMTGSLGVALTLIFWFIIIIFGRFLFGLSIGLISVITPRYLEEVIPS
jgi:MFS family permease